MERSISPDSILMIKAAQSAGVTLAWDRYEAQLPQCGFGETGLCCRHCLQGPCRIDPFGLTGPKLGICGANADTIVARGLARSIAGGTASHSAHAKHLVHTLLKWSRGEAPDYGIKDHDKFYAVLARVGISRDGKSDQELAGELAHLALAEFSEREEPPVWLKTTVTPARMKKLESLGLVPPGLDSGVAEVMHRTTNGVDADAVNVLLGGDQVRGRRLHRHVPGHRPLRYPLRHAGPRAGPRQPGLPEGRRGQHRGPRPQPSAQRGHPGRGRAVEGRGPGRGRGRGVQPGGDLLHRPRAVDAPRHPLCHQLPVAGAGARDGRGGRHRGGLPVRHAQPARGGETLPHRGRHDHADRQDHGRHPHRVRRGARRRTRAAGPAAGHRGLQAPRPRQGGHPARS